MRREIKLFGIAVLAALSLTAVMATGAQAESEFRVEGKALAEGEKAELEGVGGESQLKVPGPEFTFKCQTTLLFSSTSNLKFGGTRHAHAEHHILRHGCLPVGFESCAIYPTEEDLAKGTNLGLLLSSALVLVLLSGGFH